MTQKIVTKEEVISILGEKINFNNLMHRDYLGGRFIYHEEFESNKVYKRWKNILEIETGKKFRFNQKYFAEYLQTNSNNVSSFFRGKTKTYKGKYKLIKD